MHNRKITLGLITLALITAFGCTSYHSNQFRPTDNSMTAMTETTPEADTVFKESEKKTFQAKAYNVNQPVPDCPPPFIMDQDCISFPMDSAGDEPGKSEETISAETISTEQRTQNILDEALDLCQLSQDFWQKGEPENAIETLDNAYSLILNLDTAEKPKLIQQIDDLRFMISKRILEIYASRNVSATGKHDAIPITVNHHVQKEIDRFSGPEKNHFIQAYRRSGKYRSMIIPELKKAGLPEELSWLPLIESSFKANALSPARALGLWQFIPSTGYKFGLKRDRYIDERMDPFKATKAAISYLTELHKIFGDWSTVLAAYNCGEGRVLKVIRSQKINYLDNFWDLYEKLPSETARYVPRFLATLYMVNHPEILGLEEVDLCPVQEFEVVTVNRTLHLNEIAKAIDFPKEIMIDLNPELRHRILPPTPYPLKLPKDTKKILLAGLDSITKASVSRVKKHYASSSWVYHRVRNGDTISTIAKRYGVRINSITQANRISKKNYIVVGRMLKIPVKKSAKSSYSRRITASKNRNVTNHVVRRGDSLWLIARLYQTTTKAIMRLNNLHNPDLNIGQVLRIPKGSGVESS